MLTALNPYFGLSGWEDTTGKTACVLHMHALENAILRSIVTAQHFFYIKMIKDALKCLCHGYQKRTEKQLKRGLHLVR